MIRAFTVPARYRPFAEARLQTVLDEIRRDIALNRVPEFGTDPASPGAVTVAVIVSRAEYVAPVKPKGVAA